MWVVASRWIEAMLFAAALAALFIERQIVARLRRAEAVRNTVLSFVKDARRSRGNPRARV